MYGIVEEVSVTTSTASAATVYTGIIQGPIYSIRNGSTTFASTGTFTATIAKTGETVLARPCTANTSWYPRVAVCTSTGGSVAYSTAGGNAKVRDYYIGGGSAVKLVFANAGASVTGKFYVTHG